MGIVMLVSGGLDSTVMSLLGQEEGLDLYPLFVDYGQRAVDAEWKACQTVAKRHKLPTPKRMDLAGFGKRVASGITSRKLDVVAKAFLPGRNLLLLLAGSSYAASIGAHEVAIGLLDETKRLFEDQSRDFLGRAESLLRTATAVPITVRAPLISLSKRDVLELAKRRNVRGTYSCHAGTTPPCRKCLSCRERLNAEGG
jgi:7-cyano-7-deazaguanine synthase